MAHRPPRDPSCPSLTLRPTRPEGAQSSPGLSQGSGQTSPRASSLLSPPLALVATARLAGL
eukprot:5419555-Pleurochrysis_carterae.AAC.1